MKTMEYKGFKAKIMETARLKGDRVYGLPPGYPLDVYHADEFINYPENWMKGPGVFVVPVLPNTGLWFDWTMNSALNTAVVPTVKGCNPVTGLQTSGFHLEKYETKCPKHNIDFMGDRFCEKCGYKWPERNYISMSPLWWDGFRAEDGTVRQFFFTEEMMRDVATALIGKKNTVPAFGFAFFSPKERRAEQSITRSNISLYHTSVGTSFIGESLTKGLSSNNFDISNSAGILRNTGMKTIGFSAGPQPCAASLGEEHTNGLLDIKSSCMLDSLKSASGKKSAAPRGGYRGRFPGDLRKKKSVTTSYEEKRAPVREVAVGAGARIRQDLNRDSYPLDSWKDKPDAAITLYFVFNDKLEELKSKGMRDLKGHPEGMLNDIPVG